MLVGIVKFLHLSSLVVWVGMIVFFSFFAAPSIFKVLPRETAGEVVGDIFPKYWALGYAMSILALGTLVAWCYMEKATATTRIVLLVIMTAATFYSGLVVGSKARVIKAEMHALEDGEAKDGLRASFRRVHGLSSILNMIVFVLGLAVVFLTARGMRL